MTITRTEQLTGSIKLELHKHGPSDYDIVAKAEPGVVRRVGSGSLESCSRVIDKAVQNRREFCQFIGIA